MEQLDLINLIGKATCVRDLMSHAACTQAETWNFGALVVVAAVVAMIFAAAYGRSRTLREHNYYR